jgi:hypothetical protein
MYKIGTGAAALAVLLMLPTVAPAAENFVPLGLGYSPERQVLPPLNSPLDQLNAQTDIYESEINRIQRERAIQATELARHRDLIQDTDPILTPEY